MVIFWGIARKASIDGVEVSVEYENSEGFWSTGRYRCGGAGGVGPDSSWWGLKSSAGVSNHTSLVSSMSSTKKFGKASTIGVCPRGQCTEKNTKKKSLKKKKGGSLSGVDGGSKKTNNYLVIIFLTSD